MSDEIDAMMADLAAAQVPGRSAVERHAEFRQVFLGSEIGKRVLYDILAWGHIWRSSIVRDNAHLTYAREGERALALKILTAVHVQPTAAPAQQRSKPKE